MSHCDHRTVPLFNAATQTILALGPRPERKYRGQDDEYLGNFYTRLEQKKNHQIAIVATARKLLVSIFHMLKRKEPYDSPEVSA